MRGIIAGFLLFFMIVHAVFAYVFGLIAVHDDSSWLGVFVFGEILAAVTCLSAAAYILSHEDEE